MYPGRAAGWIRGLCTQKVKPLLVYKHEVHHVPVDAPAADIASVETAVSNGQACDMAVYLTWLGSVDKFGACTTSRKKGFYSTPLVPTCLVRG
jgi:hypothetical protein